MWIEAPLAKRGHRASFVCQGAGLWLAIAATQCVGSTAKADEAVKPTDKPTADEEPHRSARGAVDLQPESEPGAVTASQRTQKEAAGPSTPEEDVLANRTTLEIAMLQTYLEQNPNAANRAQIEKALEKLRRTPAELTVLAQPRRAQLFVDSSPSDLLPREVRADGSTRFTLEPGEHTLHLELADYQPWAKVLLLEPGEQRFVKAELKPLPPPATSAEAFGVGAPAPASVQAQEPTPSAATSRRKIGRWTSLGVASLGLGAGTVLGFLALAEERRFNDDPSSTVANRGERLALGADVCFALAIGAAVTGLVLWVVDRREAKLTTRSAASNSP